MKIIYKIVNTVAVLLIAPVLLFMPMFRFIMTMDLNLGSSLLSMFSSMIDIKSIISSATGIDFSSLPEFYTLREAYDIFFGPNAKITADSIDASAIPTEITRYFSAAGILLVLAVVLAVVVLFVGLFTKKKGLTAGFAAGGFLSVFAANMCFSHIADKLVSGEISMTTILSGVKSLEQYKSYMQYLNVDIRIFQLGSAYNLLLVVFGVMFAINIGFLLYEKSTANT